MDAPPESRGVVTDLTGFGWVIRQPRPVAVNGADVPVEAPAVAPPATGSRGRLSVCVVHDARAISVVPARPGGPGVTPP